MTKSRLVGFPPVATLQEALDRRIVITAHGREVPGNQSHPYGRIRFRGLLIPAHRLAWELERGPIPEGFVPTCPRSCIEPDHLTLCRDQSEHMQIGWARGDYADRRPPKPYTKPNSFHPLCSMSGCSNLHCAKGMCNTHYAAVRRREQRERRSSVA